MSNVQTEAVRTISPANSRANSTDYGSPAAALPLDQFRSNLQTMLAVLRRRVWWIVGCVGLLTGATILYTFQVRPDYSAEATVLIETRKTQPVDIQAVVSNLQADLSTVKGEVEIMRSPALAEKVVNKLGLLTNDQLNPPPSNWRTRAADAVRSLLPIELGAHLDDRGPSRTAPENARQKQLRQTVDNLLTHLVITTDPRSYVIKIRIDLADPKLASDVANAYADFYLVDQLEAKYEATRRVTQWLGERLDGLKSRVEDSDRAVQLFKEQHHLTVSKGATVASQQLSELNSQLILAAADRAQKETALRQVQEQIRISGGAEAASQVLASQLIQNLRQQEADVLRRQAELATHYGDYYPAMIRVKAELRDVRGKIQEEVKKVVQSLTSDAAAARARELSLRASLTNLQQTTGQQNSDEVQLRELERESDANKTLYDTFLQRFKQTSNQEDFQQPDARLVSAAAIPLRPSWPPKTLFVGLGFAVSLLIGTILALMLERLDNSVRSGEQLETLSGLPNIALVPAIRRKHGLSELIADYALTPAYTEAIRTVRTALQYSAAVKTPKVILVTSALAGEGKSTFAISLAQASVRAGLKTLLIDCDLRRPAIGGLLGKAIGTSHERPDLVSLLSGEATPEEIVALHQPSGLHVVACGRDVKDPQQLLASMTSRRYFNFLRSEYDFVIIDSPPVLLVSDSVILSQLADATLYVVRWGSTPRSVALNGLKVIRNAGAFVAGTVLTQVDLRKQSLYDFGDVGYYYKTYSKYG